MASGNWNRPVYTNQLSRRRFVNGTAAIGMGAAAAGLVGCSSNNNNKNSGARPAASAASASQSATTAAATAVRAASAPAAAASPTPAAADASTKGKPGGTLKYMLSNWPAVLDIMYYVNGYNALGSVYSSLLAFRWGVAGVPYTDFSMEPDLAQALPEQPDSTSLVFKLRPGVKFHNGRALTSDDVKFSYDTWTNDPKSPYAAQWKAWYDHTETPDPQTVVVKAKMPFADMVEATAGQTDGYILAKEARQGDTPQHIGTGPYTFVSEQELVSVTVKKNPDYYIKPFPYFDQIQLFATTDTVARLTNFTTKQVHMPWLVYADDLDQIQKQRPDTKVVSIDPYTAASAFMRSDKPPFTDKRVRQALSMGIDRTTIKNTVNKGKGDPDQFFSLQYQNLLGTHAVKDLGDAAKYWNYDPQAAKQLMSAAGITQPIETQMSHWDASVVGQFFPDIATLIQAQWKQQGLANVKDMAQLGGQYATGAGVGTYDGMGLGPRTGITGLQRGLGIYKVLYWGPNGEHAPNNNAYVNDPQLSQLAQKQLGQTNNEDRKQTNRQMEPIMAENQYYLELTTSAQYWPYDPALQNMNMSGEQCIRRYAMKWWLP